MGPAICFLNISTVSSEFKNWQRTLVDETGSSYYATRHDGGGRFAKHQGYLRIRRPPWGLKRDFKLGGDDLRPTSDEKYLQAGTYLTSLERREKGLVCDIYRKGPRWYVAW